ncbi:MAG: helix-turn-helix transcriptional regulator [Pseudoruegeria sp.]
MISEKVNLSNFHSRLDSAIEFAGYNRRSLSLKIGEGERYLNGVFHNKTYPKLPQLIKIANCLGMTLDDIAGIGGGMSVTSTEINDLVGSQAEQIVSQISERVRRKLLKKGSRPSTDDIMDWWWQNGGLLSGFENFETCMDIYTAPAPEDDMPNISHLGKDSLAAQSFNIESPEELSSIFRELPKPYLKALVLSQAEASIGEPTISYPKISVTLPSSSRTVDFTYKRLLLPVKDHSGRKFVINYSQPVRTSTI